MTSKLDKCTFFTLQQAATYAKVTRQAIYLAVKKRGLIAHKKGNRWFITQEDLDAYRASKYDRSKNAPHKMEQGEFSVLQAAKILSLPRSEGGSGQLVPDHHIYYLIRVGELKAFKKGSSWVIRKEELEELLRSMLGEDPKQLRFL